MQRLHNEGISLQLDEADEIKGMFEQREHHFKLELQAVTKKHEEILTSYQ
jgi:hypothetical protein